MEAPLLLVLPRKEKHLPAKRVPRPLESPRKGRVRLTRPPNKAEPQPARTVTLLLAPLRKESKAVLLLVRMRALQRLNRERELPLVKTVTHLPA
jgi:hypothetical protein